MRNRRKIHYVCCATGRQDPKNRRSDQKKGNKGRQDGRKTDKNKRKSQGLKLRRINLQIVTDSKQENCFYWQHNVTRVWRNRLSFQAAVFSPSGTSKTSPAPTDKTLVLLRAIKLNQAGTL